MVAKREVYIPQEASPEVTAHALALYSRSALPLRESLTKMSEEKSREFHEKFYLGYGHKSIADMAHVTMALENISVLAAIAVEDEQLWDGQERSTRYQDFNTWVTPPEFAGDEKLNANYQHHMHQQLHRYRTVFNGIQMFFLDQFPFSLPAGVGKAEFNKTVKARALDLARTTLPYGVATSVGQITSARVLERQIGRLLTSELEEIVELAQEIKAIALQPGGGAPALVKYAQADDYRLKLRAEYKTYAAELESWLGQVENYFDYEVGFIDTREYSHDVMLAATLLYPHTNYNLKTILFVLDGYSDLVDRIIKTSWHYQGKYDELPREWQTGYDIVFDVKCGGKEMQDFYRHRRMSQLRQPITDRHGFNNGYDWFVWGVPSEFYTGLTGRGFEAEWEAAMVQGIERRHYANNYLAMEGKSTAAANYMLPVGYRQRALFRMDWAQAAYIIETRTTPQAHFNCRRISREMYRQLKQHRPTLAQAIRVNLDTEVDFFKR